MYNKSIKTHRKEVIHMSISIDNVKGHYVVTIDGVFYCTCDTLEEAEEEVEFIKKEVFDE